MAQSRLLTVLIRQQFVDRRQGITALRYSALQGIGIIERE
jgi:hypothetical protein